MGAGPDSNAHTTHKRKLAHSSGYDDDDDDGQAGYLEEEEYESPRKSQKKRAKPEEKRLRRFRSQPPRDFYVVYERAMSQRFYVLNRTRTGTEYCPKEIVELTGSTGNVYHVHIEQQPWCTCPHSMGGNQCKHVIYVLSRVLRARFDQVYQLALLTSELRDIFAGAPPIEDPSAQSKDENRKPIEGDCPICFTEFEDGDAEGTVWCRAMCGQNLHAECFRMWARTKRGDEVTCPMCRAPWQKDDEEEQLFRSLMSMGRIGPDGYVNVADMLGISPHRDYSTYYGDRRRYEGYGGYDGW
ncbi:hypothetical protein GGS26DRAFT_321289 [Hypomontagnella submonticulosa]|nr:hypothetical protein GGS26DRAFT_321289 [Hypomontagnella submonticulosa]